MRQRPCRTPRKPVKFGKSNRGLMIKFNGKDITNLTMFVLLVIIVIAFF